MRRIPQKLTFMAKYGSPADRQKVSTHVDELLDTASKGTPAIYHDLAMSSEIPLESHQVHAILDSPRFQGMLHPTGMLAKFHFGDMKDEHWDKIAKGDRLRGDASTLAHMPQKHLKTASESAQDPWIRQLAKNHYASKYGQDLDELEKALKS